MLKPFPLGSCTFLLSLALINFNLIGFSSGSSRLNKNNLPESQEVSLSSYSHVNNRVTGLERQFKFEVQQCLIYLHRILQMAFCSQAISLAYY